MKFLTFLSLLFLFSSCAVVSKKECAELDWSQRAQDEIHRNFNWEKKIVKYDKVCSKHGFSITEPYMNGVYAKGGKICTGFLGFSETGWKGLGVHDALGPLNPKPEVYVERCSPYKLKVNFESYNSGVKSVGGRACSSLDNFETAGWRGVGDRDAKEGRINNLKIYKKRCQQHYFTTVNDKEFNVGFAQGLKVFCKKKSGFEFSKNGGVYQKTCKRNERSFLEGYKIGIDVRTADVLEGDLKSMISRAEAITSNIESEHREIESLNSDIESGLNSYKSEKEDIQDDIDSYTRKLSSETDPNEQDSLRDKLSDLREDATELEEDMLAKERRAKNEIESSRNKISRLREERRQIDKKILSLEVTSRKARSKANKSLKSL